MQTKTDLFYGDKVLGESLSTPGYAMDALNAWNGATQTIGMEAGRVEQLDSARHLSPYWDAYMYHWNELVSLFEKETQGAKGGLWKAPETYNLMLKIQDGVRQQEKVHNRDKSQYRG